MSGCDAFDISVIFLSCSLIHLVKSDGLFWQCVALICKTNKLLCLWCHTLTFANANRLSTLLGFSLFWKQTCVLYLQISLKLPAMSRLIKALRYKPQCTHRFVQLKTLEMCSVLRQNKPSSNTLHVFYGEDGKQSSIIQLSNCCQDYEKSRLDIFRLLWLLKLIFGLLSSAEKAEESSTLLFPCLALAHGRMPPYCPNSAAAFVDYWTFA